MKIAASKAGSSFTALAATFLFGSLGLSALGAPMPQALPASGAERLQLVESIAVPVGYGALQIYAKLKNQPFASNVAFSNQWIRSQLAAYDKAPTDYQSDLREMIDGTKAEGGLGMRQWLTDPKNVSWWDPTMRSVLGDAGYARVVSLNGAFPPGSREFQLVYGGTRLYDPATNSMMLNADKFPSVDQSAKAYKSGTPAFKDFVRFGGRVEDQMFRFYSAYAAGKVDQSKVKAFNRAYGLAGGCALSLTEPESVIKSTRYANAVNYMSNALTKLGFPLAS